MPRRRVNCTKSGGHEARRSLIAMGAENSVGMKPAACFYEGTEDWARFGPLAQQLSLFAGFLEIEIVVGVPVRRHFNRKERLA